MSSASATRGATAHGALTRRLTERVVAAYARLFAVPVPHGTPERWAAPTSFVATTLSWLAEEHARADLSPLVRQALDAAGRWLDSAPDGLREIHDPVLAQGDGKIENVLWDGEDAEHLSARLRGLRDAEALIAAFDVSKRVRARVDAYRVVLASFWLLMLLPGNPGCHRNPEGSSEYQARHVLDLMVQYPARLLDG